MRRLLKDGWPLEFFLEGGRSRTGKLLPPKLGLLSLVVDAALGVPTRTTWFCPICIGYERFVEEKAFVRELSGGEKPKESVRELVKAFELMVGRYGRLSVQFGEPLSLADVLREFDSGAQPKDLAAMSPARRRAVITRLAYRVMNEINAVTRSPPGRSSRRRCSRTTSAVFRTRTSSRRASGSRARSAATARASARRSGRRTDGASARRRSTRRSISFVRAGHVETHRVGEDIIYVVPPEARMSLDLAKNVIIHFFAPRALIATALLAVPGPPMALAAVRDRVLWMSRLFKYEFTFRADAPFERIFEERSPRWRSAASSRASSSSPAKAPGVSCPRGTTARSRSRSTRASSGTRSRATASPREG